MADTDLSTNGYDTTITVSINGRPVQVQDKIKNFNAEPMMTEITAKYLGRAGSSISQEFDGWEGSFEVDCATGALDSAFDQVIAAVIARTPLVLLITDTTYFHDGTSRTYTYPDVKITVGKKVVRGENTTHPVKWKTGSNRIAA